MVSRRTQHLFFSAADTPQKELQAKAQGTTPTVNQIEKKAPGLLLFLPKELLAKLILHFPFCKTSFCHYQHDHPIKPFRMVSESRMTHQSSIQQHSNTIFKHEKPPSRRYASQQQTNNQPQSITNGDGHPSSASPERTSRFT